jgi:hypothetical protein
MRFLEALGATMPMKVVTKDNFPGRLLPNGADTTEFVERLGELGRASGDEPVVCGATHARDILRVTTPVLSLAALIAGVLPATRAASLQPIRALRTERDTEPLLKFRWPIVFRKYGSESGE